MSPVSNCPSVCYLHIGVAQLELFYFVGARPLDGLRGGLRLRGKVWSHSHTSCPLGTELLLSPLSSTQPFHLQRTGEGLADAPVSGLGGREDPEPRCGEAARTPVLYHPQQRRTDKGHKGSASLSSSREKSRVSSTSTIDILPPTLYDHNQYSSLSMCGRTCWVG